jgi:bifunctional DNA-binding transcriptional regulator/antitoxin component of YhaV-PrlF toxin-antitoxin module
VCMRRNIGGWEAGEVAIQPVSSKQYVCTLTVGWRITIPSMLRRAQGWHQGSTLVARAERQDLFLRAAQGDIPGNNEVPCYLGSGGKVVIPTSLRSVLGWPVGGKLAVSATDALLKVSPCCHERRCRSCGATKNVGEIIQGLYLCSHCWRDYVVLARQRARTKWSSRG